MPLVYEMMAGFNSAGVKIVGGRVAVMFPNCDDGPTTSPIVLNRRHSPEKNRQRAGSWGDEREGGRRDPPANTAALWLSARDLN